MNEVMTPVGMSRMRTGRVFRALAVLVAVIATVFSMFVGAGSAFAQTTSDQKAQSELRSYVITDVAGNKYSMEGGGYIDGTDMFTRSSQDSLPTINYDQYNKLNKQGQQQFIDDIQSAMDTAANADSNTKTVNKTENVTSETTDNWLKDIQASGGSGIGSRILQNTLGQTKPDFVSANTIYRPFAGLIGTLIAVIAVIMMALLALTLAVDLAYIVLPMARGLAKVGGKDGTTSDKSMLVSAEAISAVKKAEEGEGKGVALWYYLKKRFISILVLGFCLVLLINGTIFTFVGQIVDMTFGLFNVLFK